MRIAIAVASIGIAACWHEPARSVAPAPPPIVVEVPPPIRLAVLDPSETSEARRLRILDVTRGKLAIVRDAEAPEYARSIVWAGPDPVVGGTIDGQMTFGVLRATGFADLPAIAWPGGANADGGGFMFGNARVYASDRGATLVYAHCATWNDGGYEAPPECETWDYARLWPLPVALLAAEPPKDPEVLEPTPAVVSTRVIAAAGSGAANCRDAHGVDHALHTSDTSAALFELHWLVAEPPIFLLRTWGGSGFGPGYSVDAIFEGCEVSERYTAAFIGPHHEVVLAGHDLAVYWHGKLVAHAPLEGDRVAFAPAAGLK